MSAEGSIYATIALGEQVLDRLETALWIYDFEKSAIVWANRRALALWGAESVEALAARRLKEEMSSSVKERLAQHLEDFEIYPDREIREFWTLYPDGQPFRVRAVLRRHELPFGRLGMLVEAHKEELSQPETVRSADALLHTSVITALFDLEGTELYANPAFRATFGPGSHSFGEQFVEAGKALSFVECLDGEGQHRETILVCTRHGKRWHDIFARRCRDAITGEVAILMSAVDVTVARDHQEQLVAARDAARAADRAKSVFLATISHEMRTPLNGVLGLSSLLANSHLHPKQKKMLARLRQSGVEMLGLIEDALDLVELDTQPAPLKTEPFDVALLVRSVVETYRESAAQKGLSLLTDMGSLPRREWVHAAQQIRKVLGHLVSNAVKFSESGSVLIRARLTDAETLTFEVADTGPGVPDDEREKIFSRFYQIGRSAAQPSSGAGLGLAISRELVSLWGGEIGVLPDRRKGSIFWFTVPNAIGERAADAQHGDVRA